MTSTSLTAATGRIPFLPILASALIGLAIVALSGHVQGQALHQAAHDARHATGFPCH